MPDINQILGEAPTVAATVGTAGRANPVDQSIGGAQSLAGLLNAAASGAEILGKNLEIDKRRSAEEQRLSMEREKLERDQKKAQVLGGFQKEYTRTLQMQAQGFSQVEVSAARIDLYNRYVNDHETLATDITDLVSKLRGVETTVFSETQQQETNRKLREQGISDMAAQLRAFGAYDPADGPDVITQKWTTEIAPISAKLQAATNAAKYVSETTNLSRMQKQEKIDSMIPEVADVSYNSYRLTSDQILSDDTMTQDEKLQSISELRGEVVSKMMDATGRMFTEDQLKQKLPEVFQRMDYAEKVASGALKGKDLQDLQRQTEIDDLISKREARRTMGPNLTRYNAMVKELKDTISLVPEAQRGSVLTGVGQQISEGLLVDLENFNKNIRPAGGVSQGNMAKKPEQLAKEAVDAAAEIERLSSAPMTAQVAELLSYRIKSLMEDPVNGKNAVIMDNLIPVLAKPDVVKKLREKGNLTKYMDRDSQARLTDYVARTIDAGAAGLSFYDGQYTVSVGKDGLPVFTAKPNARVSQDNLTKVQDRLHNSAKAYANLMGTNDPASAMQLLISNAKKGRK